MIPTGELNGIEHSPQQATGNVLPGGSAPQHRKDVVFIDIRSLTQLPAKHCRQAEPAENALAYAVQGTVSCLLPWNIEVL